MSFRGLNDFPLQQLDGISADREGQSRRRRSKETVIMIACKHEKPGEEAAVPNAVRPDEESHPRLPKNIEH